MHLSLVFLVFGVIFLAELPDKSMFATLVLGTKYPSFFVWVGAAAAFFTHVVIAVIAGHLLTFLPHRLLEAIVAALFLGGALLLLRGDHFGEKPDIKIKSKNHGFWKVAGTTYGVIFIGEWGDITQIMIANYVAKYQEPFLVGLGALLGLLAATTIAVFAGNKVLTRIPGKLLQRGIIVILLIFATISAIGAIRG